MFCCFEQNKNCWNISKNSSLTFPIAQKMKFSIKDFFSKCDQVHRKLLIWSLLLNRSLIGIFIFCAVFMAEVPIIWRAKNDVVSTWQEPSPWQLKKITSSLTARECEKIIIHSLLLFLPVNNHWHIKQTTFVKNSCQYVQSLPAFSQRSSVINVCHGSHQKYESLKLSW